MDEWFLAYGSSTIWPFAVLLCAAFFVLRDDNVDGWHGADADVVHNAEEDDLAFYVAMITAVHV
jgi:hypothetical protein